LNPAWDAPGLKLPDKVAVFGQDDMRVNVIATQAIQQIEEGPAGTVETIVMRDEEDIHSLSS